MQPFLVAKQPQHRTAFSVQLIRLAVWPLTIRRESGGGEESNSSSMLSAALSQVGSGPSPTTLEPPNEPPVNVPGFRGRSPPRVLRPSHVPLHASGEGVTQDIAEAIRYYNLAADQGHAGAQSNLGSAQSNLGLMYASGEGPRNAGSKARLRSTDTTTRGSNGIHG